MAGIHLYIGETGTGKTYAALKAIDGRAVIVDSGAVVAKTAHEVGLTSFPAVKREDVARIVWRDGAAARVVPPPAPHGERVVNLLAAAARAAGRCHFFVDEVSWWMSSNYCPSELEFLLRVHRHSEVTCHLTTQCPQDIPARIRSIATSVKCFRVTELRAHEVLRQWFDDSERARIRSHPNRKSSVWNAPA